jgi:hypothetical protein
MVLNIMTPLHKILIEDCVKNGWKRIGFKKAIKKRLAMKPWNECNDNYLVESINNFHIVPDCWRVIIEKWNWPILVLEFIEICVTNDLSKLKLISYNDLWWDFDSSERCHLRLFRMNIDGTKSIVLDDIPLNLYRENNFAYLQSCNRKVL